MANFFMVKQASVSLIKISELIHGSYSSRKEKTPSSNQNFIAGK